MWGNSRWRRCEIREMRKERGVAVALSPATACAGLAMALPLASLALGPGTRPALRRRPRRSSALQGAAGLSRSLAGLAPGTGHRLRGSYTAQNPCCGTRLRSARRD